jgi:glycosyltransferase involved in cell wall biosynthesis
MISFRYSGMPSSKRDLSNLSNVNENDSSANTFAWKKVEKMNICMVLFSNGWGGAETVVYQLARHLLEKGEKVCLVTNDEMVKYYSDLKGLVVFAVGTRYPRLSAQLRRKTRGLQGGIAKGVLDLCRTYIDEILRFHDFRVSRNRVEKFLRDNQVDIIHSHLADADIFVSLLREPACPHVTTIHGEHVLMKAESSRVLFKPLLVVRAGRHRRAIKMMSKVCTVSLFEKAVLGDYFKLAMEKTVVIANGINLEEIRTSLKSPARLRGGFNMVFPGGAKKSKGGDILLAALARILNRIPEPHLYVALDVPAIHDLRRMTRELGLEANVTFSGFLPMNEYWKMLAGADLFVLPARIEAFSIAALEAMALGKPIVASKTGGIPEVVKDGRNGILVAPDPTEVADAILRIYGDIGLRTEISKRNVVDAAEFDWKSIAGKYAELYREALGPT